MNEIDILRLIPGLIAWAFATVLAVIMLRRGGGKTEKLLLAGCSLLLLTIIATMIFINIRPWIREQEISAVEYSFIYSLPNGILSLAGFILIVWAFWKKFWKGRQSQS